MATTFSKPYNNLTTTLGAGGHTSGGTTVNLASGAGALFGAGLPSATTPVIFSLVKASDVTSGNINSGAVVTVCRATGRATDQLTGVTVLDGTTDQTYASGDLLFVDITAAAMVELQTAISGGITQTAVSAATTLTNTAFDTEIICSGTAANYALTLPTAVGFAGHSIVLKMSTTLTKLVTVTAAGGQTIDGAATRIMWAGEAATLQSDGANWLKISGKPIPMLAQMRAGNHTTPLAVQPITSGGTPQKVLLNGTDIDNTSMMCDPTTNNRINILRAGIYEVTAKTMYATITAPGDGIYAIIFVSGVYYDSTDIGCVVGENAQPMVTVLASLVAGDFLELDAFQNTGSSQNLRGDTTGQSSKLTVREIPQW